MVPVLEILSSSMLKLYETWVGIHPIIHIIEENEVFGRLCPIYFFIEVEILWI